MKAYLGDSVYADFNQYGQLVLTTENGLGASNTIYLEPKVYRALVNYVKESKGRPKSSMPNIGDVVMVSWNGELALKVVEQLGAHPPYIDSIMVKGLLHWFGPGEYHAIDINNHLLVPLEEDDECPNCHLGTVERVPGVNDVYACRGECGAFFRGPEKT